MKFNKSGKIIVRFISWLALLFSSLTIKFLPRRQIYPFAKNLSRIGFWLAIRQRRIALESLSMAFGKEKPVKELKSIAKECFIFMAESAIETLFMMDKPEMIKERVILENKNILDNALSSGRGVILVSGHFGNFPLMMLRLVLEGYRVGGIMRPMRDQRVDKLFAKLRQRLGIKTIYSKPRKACVDETIRSLKNNEVICFQLDQNFGTGGIFVDFFGQKAATATGPVVFALRTQSPVIPCFILRQRDKTHRVIFEQDFQLKDEGEFSKTVLYNIQALTTIIESYIRRYPAHWGWMHRRWKTRPK